MLKFIRNNLGISTKDLYCAELVTYHEKYDRLYKKSIFAEQLVPRRFILVKKVKKDWYYMYKDVFTGSKYNLYGDGKCERNNIVVYNLLPACTSKKRIKYKDAEELFENINISYLKN